MANVHETLTSLFTAIANAIRGKTGSSEAIVADGFPDAIEQIQTGLDTSDANATAGDIAKNKTAYVNGEMVTGTVSTYESGVGVNFKNASTGKGSGGIYLTESTTKDMLLRNGAKVYLFSEPSNFGDATAADVASGKTFTSSAGLKVTGTHECSAAPADPVLQSKTVTPTESQQTVSPDGGYDGLSSVTVEAIPDSYVQPSGTKQITANGTHDVADYASVDVNVPVDGIDTSETTSPAAAGDIAEGKIAFVNGEKVTGSVQVTTGTLNIIDTELTCGSTSLAVHYTYARDRLYRKNAEIVLPIGLSEFGDAEAADVVAGKTFTSTAGLKVTGTYEGGGIQAQHITSASETITISGSGTVKVWGYGYYSSGTYSKTTYAFVGDGYYTAAYSGTPSKTSASFSISDGVLSGLPSNITTLDVLVTIGV